MTTKQTETLITTTHEGCVVETAFSVNEETLTLVEHVKLSYPGKSLLPGRKPERQRVWPGR